VLDRLSIGLKGFLRDEKLFHSIYHIRRTMPEVQLIVVDDGEMTEEKDLLYAEIIREGHKVFVLPFDSGYGVKSNRIIDSLDREFIAPLADDFDFSPPSVKVGIEKALAVLDRNPELSIVSGRLANRGPYEFHLVERQPGEIYERPLTGSEYFRPIVGCDVTVNYSFIRKEVFEKVKFDDEEIIGEGGHGTFFYDVKKMGMKVAYIPGVEISEQTGRDSDRYRQFRARAHGPSRKCFEKRGINRWVLGNGIIDYDKEKFTI